MGSAELIENELTEGDSLEVSAHTLIYNPHIQQSLKQSCSDPEVFIRVEIQPLNND